MVLHRAVGVAAAHGLAVVVARVLALVGITGLMVGALIVALALSALARDERVADEACWASAHRAVVARAIEARCAVSLRSAWIRVAQVSRSEGSAGLERVSGEASWARADGLVVLHLAVGARAASAVARVHALQLVASLVVGAVVVGGALGVAPAVWVALVVLRARANSATVPDLAVSSLTAGITARIHTDVLPAGHVVGAVRIADAFGLTAGEGVADVVVDAGADGAVVAHLAVGVAAAGRGAAQFLRVEPPAPVEGIADEASWAGADGLVVPDGALGALAAHSHSAGVDALKALAGEVSWAVIGLNTFAAAAVAERVALVADGAGAHGPVSAHGAVGVDAAGRRLARVERGGRGGHADVRLFSVAANVRITAVVARAVAHSAVIARVALGVDATSSLHAHAHALGRSAAVVVRTFVISGALGLAAVDGVSVGDEIGKAPAKGDAPGAHLAPGIGPAGRGSAGVL